MDLPIFPDTQNQSLIGTAVPADTFILLETPQPWIKPALLSEGIPESLRRVIRSLLQSRTGLRVHLIANEQTSTQLCRRILIFQRTPSSRVAKAHLTLKHTPTRAYDAWEIQVKTLADMAPALEAFFEESPSASANYRWSRSKQRHLMICTHASHNECCGIHGYPFYQSAIAHIEQLGLTQNIVPWQVSHIGGHRFAPTLIDFPQGRYYGNLNEAVLPDLLKQQGPIAPVLSTYRGWSLLPKPLQLLEAELFNQHGWRWLTNKVMGRVIEKADTTQHCRVELWTESADQKRLHYIADIQNKTILACRIATISELNASQLLTRKTG
ncbi:sucrase ferredoxin [Oscillatoria sp. CS-180]|uniref:sucrase ferredoxin n=1 Tax=Oscillatoria sp. CS-180 TaxID=3021720 RepID=UPI00232BEC55|nr:sucrase ferredoxin [Oscillatoria sp. CS-180]MDB9524951.1 sucrase ferredoxin [Oscillatoria sp. CS-180]